MICKLSTLRIEGHPYIQRDIANMAEKIISEGYRQDPPLVVQWRFSYYYVIDGILRFLALSYIARYSSHKVIPKGIKCVSSKIKCGSCSHTIRKGKI